MTIDIDILPDDVLLKLFRSYLDEAGSVDAWHTLVHVCRRWRNVVFASPRHLNLRLLFTYKRPVREMLDIWPTLPIVVSCHGSHSLWGAAENISAALEHNDRVSEIDLHSVTIRWLEKFSAVEAATFPVLTSLDLRLCPCFSSPDPPEPFLLVGSAPRLRTLRLGGGSPFQGVQRLLLSARDLVHLHLDEISCFGHIFPEAMVTCLSALTKLESLHFALNTPPDLLSIQQADIDLRSRVLSFSLSRIFFSKAIASSWRIFCPELMSLFSALSL
ncbi:hypothetical protein BJV74DRAFT_367600 [Russula compacta]|nr:hypothetical protein BJV74DRAFT_367600 [Russula compacta]